MFLYVYDKTLTLLGIVEKITSLIWTERKYTCGEFKMLLPASSENLDLLQKGRLLVRDDDEDGVAGEILYRQIKKSVSGSETLEITGKLLAHWLGNRLRLNAAAETAKPQVLMRNAVYANAVTAGAGSARGFPLLILGTQAETRVQSNMYYKPEEDQTVLAVCEDLAAATDTGFIIKADTAAKQFKFDTYTGADHTQGSASPCIFSVEFENILEQEFTQSVEDEKNFAYVYGAEDSTATLPVTVGTATGHDRKEVYINASGVKQDTMTDAQYEAALATNGENVLQQCKEKLSFFSKINAAAGNFTYGVDYRLGDKVTCINSSWGVSVDAVVTEAQTEYEKGQKTVYLTFGEALPTLLNQLKNLKKR